LLDVALLDELTGGDRRLSAAFLEDALKDMAQSMGAVQHAAAVGPAAALEQAIHRLKGIVSAMSSDGLVQLLDQLRACARLGACSNQELLARVSEVKVGIDALAWETTVYLIRSCERASDEPVSGDSPSAAPFEDTRSSDDQR
jgi:hypothetical protein